MSVLILLNIKEKLLSHPLLLILLPLWCQLLLHHNTNSHHIKLILKKKKKKKLSIWIFESCICLKLHTIANTLTLTYLF